VINDERYRLDVMLVIASIFLLLGTYLIVWPEKIAKDSYHNLHNLSPQAQVTVIRVIGVLWIVMTFLVLAMIEKMEK
jgi:hypothetical protein